MPTVVELGFILLVILLVAFFTIVIDGLPIHTAHSWNFMFSFTWILHYREDPSSCARRHLYTVPWTVATSCGLLVPAVPLLGLWCHHCIMDSLPSLLVGLRVVFHDLRY